MRRVTIETTLYGKRVVSYAQLVQLHREVTRAASLARQSDPVYRSHRLAGIAAAQGREARR